MPGGQYTNLYQQAQALGLGDRWHEVCRMYAEVNQLFGDIVKVTPTSKVVGDMALFMVAQQPDAGATCSTPKRELAFPESVVEFFEGKLGQPPGGFPQAAAEARPARPQAAHGPARRDAAAGRLRRRRAKTSSRSSAAAPTRPRRASRTCSTRRCSPTSSSTSAKYSDTSVLPTPVFFYGMEPGEEISVDIEPGKTLIIKFLTVGEPHADGRRPVFFELNGQPREVLVARSSRSASDGQGRAEGRAGQPDARRGADAGRWSSRVAVAAGDEVAAGQKLLTLEAMKMETTLYAERAGKVAEVLVRPGTQVEAGDLVIRFE